jgi:flagellar biosynthesis protein FlhG
MMRQMMLQEPTLEIRTQRERARPAAEAIVVASGKGGVGKSTLAALLGTELAAAGRRVLLLDGSLNQGNLHVLLGVPASRGLASLLLESGDPRSLVLPVGDRLALLPAASGSEELQRFGPLDRARLHRRLSDLFDSFDTVVVDAGTGFDGAIRAATIRASRLVAVAIPEPTSLVDAYAVVKLVHLQAPRLAMDLLVNRVEEEAEGVLVYERLRLAVGRFLDRTIGYLGSIRERREIRQVARTPGAILSYRNEDVTGAARRLLETPPAPDGHEADGSPAEPPQGAEWAL